MPLSDSPKKILTTDCSAMQDILCGYPAGRIVANNDEAFYDGLVKHFQHPEVIDIPASDSNRFSLQKPVKENESFFEALINSSKQ